MENAEIVSDSPRCHIRISVFAGVMAVAESRPRATPRNRPKIARYQWHNKLRLALPGASLHHEDWRYKLGCGRFVIRPAAECRFPDPHGGVSRFAASCEVGKLGDCSSRSDCLLGVRLGNQYHEVQWQDFRFQVFNCCSGWQDICDGERHSNNVVVRLDPVCLT